MRGFGLLVLFGVACSASATNDLLEATLAQAGAGGDAGSPAAVMAGAAPSVAGSGDVEAAGAPGAGKASHAGAAGAIAGQGGASAGAPASAGAGDGGKSSGGAGGFGGLGGSVGGQATGGETAAAGQGGAANQCTGFTTYTVDVNTCLSVTGDYQQQTDLSCAPAGIRLRDHCSTCASWSAPKPLVVMLSLADGASVKRYDTVSGVCPSNCKYICDN